MERVPPAKVVGDLVEVRLVRTVVAKLCAVVRSHVLLLTTIDVVAVIAAVRKAIASISTASSTRPLNQCTHKYLCRRTNSPTSHSTRASSRMSHAKATSHRLQ